MAHSVKYSAPLLFFALKLAAGSLGPWQCISCSCSDCCRCRISYQSQPMGNPKEPHPMWESSSREKRGTTGWGSTWRGSFGRTGGTCKGFWSPGLSHGMCHWRIYKVSFLFHNGKLYWGGNYDLYPCWCTSPMIKAYLTPPPYTLHKWDKFAVSGCELGSGLCADVTEGRICLISTNTICMLGSDECSVLETTHFAYIRTNDIAKICSTFLVFSNNYWWVANICYFSPEQWINYSTETTGHSVRCHTRNSVL